MSGDVMIAHDLNWAQNSWVWDWALTTLAVEVTRPGAKAALDEARFAGITMDVEALAVADRDDVYVAAATGLVPAAVDRFGHAAPYDELAAMAGEALRRYRGRPVADFEVRLTDSTSWWTHTSSFNSIRSFLAEFMSSRDLAENLDRLAEPGESLLDLTTMADHDRTEALTLLRDRFVRDIREIAPPNSATVQHHLARARELADLAGKVLARPDLHDRRDPGT